MRHSFIFNCRFKNFWEQALGIKHKSFIFDLFYVFFTFSC